MTFLKICWTQAACLANLDLQFTRKHDSLIVSASLELAFVVVLFVVVAYENVCCCFLCIDGDLGRSSRQRRVYAAAVVTKRCRSANKLTIKGGRNCPVNKKEITVKVG